MSQSGNRFLLLTHSTANGRLPEIVMFFSEIAEESRGPASRAPRKRQIMPSGQRTRQLLFSLSNEPDEVERGGKALLTTSRASEDVREQWRLTAPYTGSASLSALRPRAVRLRAASLLCRPPGEGRQTDSASPLTQRGDERRRSLSFVLAVVVRGRPWRRWSEHASRVRLSCG